MGADDRYTGVRSCGESRIMDRCNHLSSVHPLPALYVLDYPILDGLYSDNRPRRWLDRLALPRHVFFEEWNRLHLSMAVVTQQLHILFFRTIRSFKRNPAKLEVGAAAHLTLRWPHRQHQLAQRLPVGGHTFNLSRLALRPSSFSFRFALASCHTLGIWPGFFGSTVPVPRAACAR